VPSNVLIDVVTAIDTNRGSIAPAVPALDVAAIHAAHAGFVWASLQRLGVREADLEDQLQEVFVVVHRRLGAYDPDSSVVAWLFGICLKVASTYRRSAYVRREHAVEAVPDDRAATALADTPEDAAVARQARARLLEILDEMDLERRAVFVMYEIDELPCEDIAATLGVPVGTVYSRLHAARREFQRALARWRARTGSDSARGGRP
jgi:RNA polymerase sigma-70 factor (ECF subfamily)